MFLRAFYYFDTIKIERPKLKYDHLQFFVLYLFFILGVSINIIHRT